MHIPGAKKASQGKVISMANARDQDVQGSSRYNVPALEKGLDILELLAGEPGGLNVTEISQRLGRSTGELYRLIQYLDWRGYLERNRDGDRYQLSMRMFRLSHEHPPVRSLVSVALPLMEELTLNIGQSCHMGVLDRASVVIVGQVDSPLAIRYSVRLGAQFPIWETSSGLLIAAYLTSPDKEKVFELLERLIEPDEIEAFRRKIGEIYKRGFEERPSELIPGIINISRPVFNHVGKVAAAITVPFLGQRGNPVSIGEVEAAVERTAEAISTALGHGVAS